MTPTGRRGAIRLVCGLLAMALVGGCGPLAGEPATPPTPTAVEPTQDSAPAMRATPIERTEAMPTRAAATPDAPPAVVVNRQAPAAPAAPALPAVSRSDVLQAVDLSDLDAGPVPVALSAGQNEWVSVVLRVRTPAAGQGGRLALPQWRSGDKTLSPRGLRAYQVLPMPQNVNRAGYVRQTGQAVSAETLPRALLPVPISGNRVDLTRLRDPERPTDPRATSVDGNVLIWVEFRMPTDKNLPGHYDGAFAWETPAVEKTPAAVRATVAGGLDVADFVLPDDRHLNMVADLSWDRLQRLWPDRFEVVRPQLMSRQSPDSRPAVEMLDQLMQLAQENRVEVHIPRLQPVAKWKPNLPVQLDWADYDALVGPWLTGSAFADKVGLGFWALPKVDYLENRPPASQIEYYGSAAGHFDGRDWLRLSPVVLTKDTPGQASLEERLRLSAEAERVLEAQRRVRVMLPLEPGELALGGQGEAGKIDPADTGRLNCVAPGLISNSPLQALPQGVAPPHKFLRTDLSGLIPYTGAGATEADVRVWAWTAFVREADTVQWDAGLPRENAPDQAADPNELVWFYPGSWFGVEAPLPTVQLKWLRRAEQDFEYLYLATQRGSRLETLPIARVLSKPVVIQPNQKPDPVYSLLLGTADEAAWRSVGPLMTKIVQSRSPGTTADPNDIADLQQQMLEWIEPLERPIILPRSTEWTVGLPPAGEAGTWVNLRLGFDVYNSSDTTPQGNELDLVNPNRGWMVDAAGVPVPQLAVFSVARQGLNARLDSSVTATTPQPPVRIDYKSKSTGASTPLTLVVPVRQSLRRTARLIINGSLDDWSDEDAFQIGPLVKMVSRPSVQRHALEFSPTPSKLYSGWTDDNLYVAFHVEGLARQPKVLASRNFVDYQDGRAWGEDVCQLVMQAVYEDGTTGPLVTVSVKPGGNDWGEKRDTARSPWTDLQTRVEYATTIDAGVWRGEVKVPWDALIDPAKTAAFAAQAKPNLPTLVKFNFVQHKRDTGESSTWAGPVDTARDGAFTGVLVLKEAE